MSILGVVYDVSKGPEYYAPGNGYSIFAGRDGTVPFVTGKFTDEECEKGSDALTDAQLYNVDTEWSEFYAKESKYPFVGFLCCRYYDENGYPTDETLRVKERIATYAKIKAEKDRQRKELRKKRMNMTDPKQAKK